MFKKFCALFLFIILSSQPILGLTAPNPRFNGKELDPTGLNYYGQRYYNSNTGQFTQVDPVLRELHDDSYLKSNAGLSLEDVLKNPQSLNSYSYTANNPVKSIDPDGRTFKQVITGKQSPKDYQIEVGQTGEIAYNSNSTARLIMDHPVATGAVVGVVGGLLAYAAVGLITKGVEVIGTAVSYLFQNRDQGEEVVTKLNNLTRAQSAQEKLEKFSKIINKPIEYILDKASKSLEKYIDTAHDGNINIYTENPINPSKLIRITLNPEQSKIISAGISKISNVMNNITNGRFIKQ